MTVPIPTSTPPTVTPSTYTHLETLLLSPTTPLSKRFRALFTLKALNNQTSISIIASAFTDSSALLKHELAYVLGQMRNADAIPHLVNVLEDKAQDVMVRHEAAEALGAIGVASQQVLDILKKYHQDPNEERVVRETCELAIQLLTNKSPSPPSNDDDSPYTSIDPAPPLPNYKSLKTSELESLLLDTSKPLFERYKAMFALRNRGDRESVLALAEGFGDESALFRHEIAYVFGQLQSPHSIPSLTATLCNTSESPMVRHECAEALGSIAQPECFEVLKQFVGDAERVVSESCVVGLDMAEYEVSGELQYADGLVEGKE